MKSFMAGEGERRSRQHHGMEFGFLQGGIWPNGNCTTPWAEGSAL